MVERARQDQQALLDRGGREESGFTHAQFVRNGKTENLAGRSGRSFARTIVVQHPSKASLASSEAMLAVTDRLFRSSQSARDEFSKLRHFPQHANFSSFFNGLLDLGSDRSEDSSLGIEFVASVQADMLASLLAAFLIQVNWADVTWSKPQVVVDQRANTDARRSAASTIGFGFIASKLASNHDARR